MSEVTMIAGYAQVTREMARGLGRFPTFAELVEADRRERELTALHGPRLGPPAPDHCTECGQVIPVTTEDD